LNDKVYAFNYKSKVWSTKAVSIPSATSRYNHVAEVNEFTGTLYIFGGQVAYFQSINNLSSLQLEPTWDTLTATDVTSTWTAAASTTGLYYPPPIARTQAGSIKLYSSNVTGNIPLMVIYGGLNSTYTSTSASLKVISGSDSWLALDLATGRPANPNIANFIPFGKFAPLPPQQQPLPVPTPTTVSVGGSLTLTASPTATQSPVSFPVDPGSTILPDDFPAMYGPSYRDTSLVANFAFVANGTSINTTRAYLFGGGIGDQTTNGFWLMNAEMEGAWNWTQVTPTNDVAPKEASVRGVVLDSLILFFVPVSVVLPAIFIFIFIFFLRP
jgi:hypothetical protein